MSAPYKEESVCIPLINGHELHALLAMPVNATRVIVLADGERRTLQSRAFGWLATNLNEAGLGTLLLDLLTPDEAQNPETAATVLGNLATLAGRFGTATRYLTQRFKEQHLTIGYCASGAASAAALSSSLAHYFDVRLVVSLEGLPHLARHDLEDVSAATLLVAPGDHAGMMQSNRTAFASLNCAKKLAVVSGASRLLEEERPLRAVADVTRRWFERQVTRAERSPLANDSYG